MKTPLPIYDFVMAQLRAKRIPQRQVARESGVPFSTVCKIAQGYVADPSVHTVQRLADYFRSTLDPSEVAAKQEVSPITCGASDPRHGERRDGDRRDDHNKEAA